MLKWPIFNWLSQIHSKTLFKLFQPFIFLQCINVTKEICVFDKRRPASITLGIFPGRSCKTGSNLFNKINIHIIQWWCTSSYFYSEKYLSYQAGLESTIFWSPVRRRRFWVRVPLGNSDIFLSKNSSKNIIITIFTSELAYIF